MQKDIGLGPSLFLMTLKALSYLFLLLTILNLPLYFCFYAGNPLFEAEFGKLLSLPDFFSELSIGKIGLSIPTCTKAIWYTDAIKERGPIYIEYILNEEFETDKLDENKF